MVKTADVVVENFRPDVKARLGIDYKRLRKINPRLVYASISGFGQSGPYVDRPGFDQSPRAWAAWMSITGEPGQGPLRVGIPVADLTAGLTKFGAMEILVALLEREKSKKGQQVDTSLLEAQIFMLDLYKAAALSGEWRSREAGRRQPSDQYSDRRLQGRSTSASSTIATAGQKIWDRCAEALDAPELAKRPEYATSTNRLKNRDALNAEINALTAKRPSAEWVERFNEAGVPCGPIYSIDQMFADPQVKHVGIAQPVKTKDKTPLTLLGQPVSLSRTPSRLVAPPSRARASTPTRCSRNSASAPNRSPHCARPMRSDPMRSDPMTWEPFPVNRNRNAENNVVLSFAAKAGNSVLRIFWDDWIARFRGR